MSDCILYDYPKSSSSYRVRIGLNLAGITYQRVLVNLLADEQTSPEHRARNPQGLVPVLDIDGTRLTQSLAILDYLDSTRNLVLTPVGAAERARVLALAHSIAVDVQPVGNLSVLRRATNMQDPQRSHWMHACMRPGLLAFEAQLAHWDSPSFCTAEHPTLPDLCLIPMLYNAQRWQVDYSDCPRILAIEQACQQIPAFTKAHPDNG